MQTHTLKTERLLFRHPDATDLAPYTAFCRSDRTRFVGGPFGETQAFDKLAAMIGHWELRGFGRYVFCEGADGRALGHVGALHPDMQERPELTWTIWNGADEGKGYATEAGAAYLHHAQMTLGLTALMARVMADNLPSLRVAERLGGILNASAKAPDWFPGSVTYDFTLQR